MECRMCGAKTYQFLDLGKQPIANGLLTQLDLDAIQSNGDKEYFYNLSVHFCPDCFLVQISECPAKECVFNENYVFFTSTSEFMKKHFNALADEIKREYMDSGDFIVEIGSNDGTFLRNFPTVNHLGIEPSRSVWEAAAREKICTWNRFFDEALAERIVDEIGQAKVIVSTNVFPHMIERKSVLAGIKKLLAPDGIWINEEASLRKILQLGSYDQFYNEHIYFSSISSFAQMADMNGMKLLEQTKPINVHGGSMRYYVSHADCSKYTKMSDVIINSDQLWDFRIFEDFHDRVEITKRWLKMALESLKKPAFGYGATAKSTTVLNFCNIDSSLIDRIYDTTPVKWNKYSPGMHIPIRNYEHFAKEITPHQKVVLFAWNHKDEIFEKESDKPISWILPI